MNLIEADERRMIHSVIDLGDTITREVMVPRTDMVVIDRDKTRRQGLNLSAVGYLRSRWLVRTLTTSSGCSTR